MRNFPTDKYDLEDLARLNAEPWMVELLKLNPEYTCWGPHEDYMSKDRPGWDSRIIAPCWGDLEPTLDDLNEVVNFYFSVEREQVACKSCDQSGYNAATKQIADDFYDHSSYSGEGWHNKITQDEVQALADEGRLIDFTHTFVPGTGWQKKSPPYVPTAQEVNKWASKGMGHDAINRCILIKARAKRLGVYGHCEDCDGRGYIYTEPTAHVALTLWVLHPRKGCSRGVEISRVQRSELPAIFKYLAEAASRNAARFAKVTKLA